MVYLPFNTRVSGNCSSEINKLEFYVYLCLNVELEDWLLLEFFCQAFVSVVYLPFNTRVSGNCSSEINKLEFYVYLCLNVELEDWLLLEFFCQAFVSVVYLPFNTRVSGNCSSEVKKLEFHSAITSCNSYASFVLSKLPACIHNSIYAR